jgi:hypothetical protein
MLSGGAALFGWQVHHLRCTGPGVLRPHLRQRGMLCRHGFGPGDVRRTQRNVPGDIGRQFDRGLRERDLLGLR